MEQIREPDPKYQIGKGKAEELAQSVKDLAAEKVIFDNPIKSVQAYHLSKLAGVEVIDRFHLILEIFARRASTTEAKLQIELAKSRYELPRAREKVRLAKLGEQPGFMGLGAYEVDVYYETIQRQVHTIQAKLKRIRGKRQLHRARRLELGFPLVSLAGYTGAGKSCLFNALAEEFVPVDTGLFTTLSTTTRVVNLSGKRVLLTDTVGFIDRLPLTLIEAFHSTLEETIFSDLILLVVDVSEPLSEIERKLSVCSDTIQTIGASGIPVVTALNKIDLVSHDELQSKVEALRGMASNSVPISALYKTNVTQLQEEMTKRLRNYVQAAFSIPATSESLSFLSWLFNRADVRSLTYTEDGIDVAFESLPWFADKVRGQVEHLGGAFNAAA